MWYVSAHIYNMFSSSAHIYTFIHTHTHTHTHTLKIYVDRKMQKNMNVLYTKIVIHTELFWIFRCRNVYKNLTISWDARKNEMLKTNNLPTMFSTFWKGRCAWKHVQMHKFHRLLGTKVPKKGFTQNAPKQG